MVFSNNLVGKIMHYCIFDTEAVAELRISSDATDNQVDSNLRMQASEDLNLSPLGLARRRLPLIVGAFGFSSLKCLKGLRRAVPRLASIRNRGGFYLLRRRPPAEYNRSFDCLLEGNKNCAYQAPILVLSVAKLTFNVHQF